MHKTTALSLSSTVALIAACVGIAAPSRADTGALSLRSKVAFVPNDITINGQPRPDIGRALADSFSAAALKRGKYRIFNIEPPAPVRPIKVRKRDLQAVGAPVPAQVSIMPPVPKDVDFLYTFNVVGENDRYAITMKKVRAENNEVLEAHDLSTSGRLDRLFAIVPQALDQIDAKLYPPAFPRTQSPEEIRAPMVYGDQRYSRGRYHDVSPAFANVDLTKVPKALIYQRLGTICATNEPWRFAVINPVGPYRVAESEHLDVQWNDGGPGVYARLKVSSHDSGKVIADYGSNPSYHKLYPGDGVYGWAPPMQ